MSLPCSACPLTFLVPQGFSAIQSESRRKHEQGSLLISIIEKPTKVPIDRHRPDTLDQMPLPVTTHLDTLEAMTRPCWRLAMNLSGVLVHRCGQHRPLEAIQAITIEPADHRPIADRIVIFQPVVIPVERVVRCLKPR